MQNKLILLQFPISHFCEKVRWALDHKSISYKKRSLVPGVHALTTKKHGRSSVPVLLDGASAVQGSAAIIDYLEQRFPENPLTPADPELEKKAHELEAYADNEIGPHVRRLCYHVLLERPDVVVPLFAADESPLVRAGLRIAFPALRKAMRKGMRIDPEGAERSARKVHDALDHLEAVRGGNDYLVGEAFSRADLAACALLAPLWLPSEYGVSWPEPTPHDFAQIIAPYESKLAWARSVYEKHR